MVAPKFGRVERCPREAALRDLNRVALDRVGGRGSARLDERVTEPAHVVGELRVGDGRLGGRKRRDGRGDARLGNSTQRRTARGCGRGTAARAALEHGCEQRERDAEHLGRLPDAHNASDGRRCTRRLERRHKGALQREQPQAVQRVVHELRVERAEHREQLGDAALLNEKVAEARMPEEDHEHLRRGLRGGASG